MSFGAGERLSGVIERVTFHNPENGYSVLKLKVKGEREYQSLVGSIMNPTMGEWCEADGVWHNDKKYGKQFKATAIRTRAPDTAIGIQKYLGSGIIKGIRESTAEKLVKAFGKKVLDVIENQPEKIKAVSGITTKQYERIISSWDQIKSIRQLIELLSEHGITPAQISKIHKIYENEAVIKIQNNPYCLVADIQGISFQMADALAMKLGVSKESPERCTAALIHILTEALISGHSGLPRMELILAATKLTSMKGEVIAAALEGEIDRKAMNLATVQQEECIFLAKWYQKEVQIANNLMRLKSGELPWGRPVMDKILEWIDSESKIQLSASQKEAFSTVLRNKVSIITGGPGVGKTTLVKSLLAVMKKAKCQVMLAAPTGRAAKRLYDVTGNEAKTIHRLLQINPNSGFIKRECDEKLNCDILIVDEMSMVDIQLFSAIVEALPNRAALIMVGDVDQLPSIGAGSILLDMISSGYIPSIRLSEVYRQSSNSHIISVAHTINRGEVPLIKGLGKDSDLFFMEVDNLEDNKNLIVDIVTRRLPQNMNLNPWTDIQVLTPMNNGGVGTKALNEAIQAIMNPQKTKGLTRNGYHFSTGDKVMQIRNNYNLDVFNGDIGIIREIDFDEEVLLIDYDGTEVEYDFTEADDLVLSYATTIHKAQGAEYPAVVIPVVRDHYVMLQRNLIYTAVTRGKKLVVMVGERSALTQAVMNDKGRRRWTLLGEKLKSYVGAPQA